ncbi:MAG: lysophospholipid acyltransferase family protein, partial [Gammaproteobacteria bacterium]
MRHSLERRSPFELAQYLDSERARRLAPLLSLAERALALDGLDATYRATTPGGDPAKFIDELLDTLNVTVEVDPPDGELIPREGPVIVMSNHPFGGIDGIILPRMLLNHRHDVRIMANFFLENIPELKPLLLSVDPFGGNSAMQRNVTPTRRTIRWLRDGHALAVFPSGEVSHLNLRSRSVVDPMWQPSLARIARLSRASVVPVYFDGRNSALFQAMGLVHPRLRTLMLPRE